MAQLVDGTLVLRFMVLMADPAGEVVGSIAEEKRPDKVEVQVTIAQYANIPSPLRGPSSPPSIPPELFISNCAVLLELQRC
ncbi:hypothetical protein FF2_023926 [Malus domestica]